MLRTVVKVRQILLSEQLPQMAAMFESNWQEVEPHLSDVPPKPMTENYLALERAGRVLAFGAFDGDELVGYAVGVSLNHPHYSFPYVEHDLLYVHPRYRASSAGTRLISELRSKARESGARFVFWHAKPESKFRQILEHTGSVMEEVVYREAL